MKHDNKIAVAARMTKAEVLELVVAAEKRHAAEISGMERSAYARLDKLRRDGHPLIAFLGKGSCGKSSVVEHLARELGLRAGGTTSSVFSPWLASSIQLPESYAFSKRGEFRSFWYLWARCFSRHDPARICRLGYALSDLCGGIRDSTELQCAKLSGLVDCTVWIERPGSGDGTVSGFGPEDCDYVLENSGSVESLLNNALLLVNDIRRGLNG